MSNPAATAEPPAVNNPVLRDDVSFEDFLGSAIDNAAATPAPPDPDPAAVTAPEPAKPPVVEPVKEPADPLSMLDLKPTEPVKEPAIVEKFGDKPPGKASDNANRVWAELRQEHKQATTKLTELEKIAAEKEAKLAELTEKLKGYEGKQAVAKEEWEEIEKERQTSNTTLKLLRLESSPEYQKAVTEPMKKVATAAEAIAAKHGLDPKKLVAALSDSDVDARANVLSELVDNLSVFEQQKVLKLADQIEQIEERKMQLKSDVDKSLAYITDKQQKEQEAIAAQREQNRVEALKQAGTDLVKSGLFLHQKREGDEWQGWNARIDQINEAANKIDLHQLPATVSAKILLQALHLPASIEATRQAHARITELEAALEKYVKVTPGAGSGGSAITEPTPNARPVNEGGFLDSFGKLS